MYLQIVCGLHKRACAKILCFSDEHLCEHVNRFLFCIFWTFTIVDVSHNTINSCQH